MVVVAMMKKNHEQFIEQLQHFIDEFSFIDHIVIMKNPSLMKNKGF